MKSGFAIQSVTPQKWSPGFSPMHVSLEGAWRPAPLPTGPGGVTEKVAQSLGIAMSSDPGAALGQAGVKAMAAGSIALVTLPMVATAYVGFRLGTKDSGFPMILGYLVGSLASLGVLLSLLSMVGVIALPMPPAAAAAAPAASPPLA